MGANRIFPMVSYYCLLINIQNSINDLTKVEKMSDHFIFFRFKCLGWYEGNKGCSGWWLREQSLQNFQTDFFSCVLVEGKGKNVVWKYLLWEREYAPTTVLCLFSHLKIYCDIITNWNKVNVVHNEFFYCVICNKIKYEENIAVI